MSSKKESLELVYQRLIAYWEKELKNARLQKAGDDEAEALEALKRLKYSNPSNDT